MEEALLVAVGYSDNSGTPDLLLLSLSSGGAFLLLHGIRRGDNPSFAYGDRKLYVGCKNEASATIARYGVAGGSLCLEEEYVVPYGGLCHLLLKDGLLLGSRYLDGAFFALDAGGGGIRWQYKNEQAGQPRAHWMQANGDTTALLAADLGADMVCSPWEQMACPPGCPWEHQHSPGRGAPPGHGKKQEAV